MIINYDYLSRETPKAVQLVKGCFFCWIPKSCFIKNPSSNHAEVIDSFTVEWKDESYKIVRTEGGQGDDISGASVGREARQIVLTDNNRNELWEYI